MNQRYNEVLPDYGRNILKREAVIQAGPTNQEVEMKTDLTSIFLIFGTYSQNRLTTSTMSGGEKTSQRVEVQLQFGIVENF